MNIKPFKTYNDQIAILKERGIDFSDPNSKRFAKRQLQRIGYYSLINGYSRPFMLEHNKYKEGTTFNEIYYLYNFDKKMRDTFLKYILPVETNIKSLIAYTFSEQHSEPNYLVYSNFDIKSKDAHRFITELLSEIQRQIYSRSSDPCISHYLKNYGYVPLWVLGNILTFGTMSKFYSLMNQNERQTIAKIFKVTDSELISMLNFMSTIRNICAHGNRLYCFKSKKMLCDTKYHKSMNIPYDDSKGYLYGKYDLFALMIIFKSLLSRAELNRLIKSVENNLKYVFSGIKTLSNEDILSMLGFPNNWKELLRQHS